MFGQQEGLAFEAMGDSDSDATESAAHDALIYGCEYAPNGLEPEIMIRPQSCLACLLIALIVSSFRIGRGTFMDSRRSPSSFRATG